MYFKFFCFLVKAMAITFAILAQGSAFWHGSETVNGGAADVRINDLFAYVAYQAVMQKVVPLESSIIHDLSLTPRVSNGNQITSDFVDMYINDPVEEWGTKLEAADIPNLRLTMCGYFGTALSLLYEEDLVNDVVKFLLDQFPEYVSYLDTIRSYQVCRHLQGLSRLLCRF